MNQRSANKRDRVRAYAASWFDRFNERLDDLPVPDWTVYLGFGTVLIVLQVLVFRLEGNAGPGSLLPVIVFNSLATPFLLGLMHTLDRRAVEALNSLRPVLQSDPADIDAHEYRLANMPVFPPLASGLVMLSIALLMEQLTAAPVRYASLESLDVFPVVFHTIDKSSAFLFGVFLYHTIRQLRFVGRINVEDVHINLFNLRPLESFSSLTASTAAGMVVFVYGWLLINPDLLADPLILLFAGVIAVLTALVFIWPLWGIHRLIEGEKARAIHEIDLGFEAAFSKFNQYFRADDYASIDRLNGIIASLEVQHRRVSAIPTWPWGLESARLAFSAIAGPLTIMILQLVIQRVF